VNEDEVVAVRAPLLKVPLWEKSEKEVGIVVLDLGCYCYAEKYYKYNGVLLYERGQAEKIRREVVVMISASIVRENGRAVHTCRSPLCHRRHC
jgi:hypothetical protein